MKKVLFGAWTDNEEASSSSDEEETMNIVSLCMMGLEEEVLSPDSQSKFTFDELNFVFHELMSKFKKAKSRIKIWKDLNENLQKEKDKFSDENDTLKRELTILSEKCITFEKEKKVYIDDNRRLSNENINLKKKIEKLEPLVDKLTLSSNKLELLLKDKKDLNYKTRIGYNSKITK